MAGLITDTERQAIQRLIAHATNHPCPLDLNNSKLDEFGITIDGYRVYYLHHQHTAHLSVHGKPNTRLPDHEIDVIADAFGFGPRGSSWRVLNRLTEPSVHIFLSLKRVEAAKPPS